MLDSLSVSMEGSNGRDLADGRGQLEGQPQARGQVEPRTQTESVGEADPLSQADLEQLGERTPPEQKAPLGQTEPQDPGRVRNHLI